MHNLVSIGRMAEMNGVTVATLRLYDEMNLLKPRRTDPKTGYRYYDISQNARLDMIAYMKELGMSLSEIQDILEKEDITLIETLLVKKNEQLHEQMRELKSRHAAVERAIASIEKYRKSPTNGTVSLEYIDRRYTYGRPCRHNFYEMDAASFEEELVALRQELVKKGFLHVHSYNVGTTITQVNFEQGVFIPEESFVFVDHKDRDIVPGVKVLDSGMFACIYLDHFDEETAYALKLRDHCRAQGWILDGDYICEIITEFNVFDSEKRSMFMRLQVPVRFS
mgnify:FL=1